MPGLFWIFFLFFPISSLPFVAALAGATMGTATSAVAHMASVKSRIADLLMRVSCDWSKPMLMPTDGTLRRNKRYRGNRIGPKFGLHSNPTP
jgi:hypothetical protein